MGASSSCNVSCINIQLSRAEGEDRFTATIAKSPHDQDESFLWTSPPLLREEAVEQLRGQGVQGDIEQMLQDLVNFSDSEGQGSNE